MSRFIFILFFLTVSSLAGLIPRGLPFVLVSSSILSINSFASGNEVEDNELKKENQKDE